MSSLSAQLSQIATANQTVALDRKKRSKLHSVSLIYDPKFAATQDYESIYSNSLDALEELENIDRRFSRFRSTLFSETSIDVDRLVQSKEQNQNLNLQVNAFLNLLSPYWHLTISIKATEWLVRRFQINVYNAEELLLSTLPFYNHAVFHKILYVISTQNFPNIFQTFVNFKKMGKLPSQNVIIKAFTDQDFLKFYSNHLVQQISHTNLINQRQLVLYLTCSIASIAALQSNDLNKLSQLTPFFLETSGELLKSASKDCHLTAYSILAVLATAIPLSKDVLLACIESMLSTGSSSPQCLASVLKLVQTLQSPSLETFPQTIFQLLTSVESSEELQDLITKDQRNKKFLTMYIKSSIVYGHSLSKNFINDVVLKIDSLSKTQFKSILHDLVVENKISDVQSSTTLFKWLIKLDKEFFLNSVKAFEIDLATLEMSLQTTLVDEELDEGLLDFADDDEAVEEDVVMTTEESDGIELSKATSKSFLVSNSIVNREFNSLLPAFIKAIANTHYSKFNKAVFPTPQCSITFLLRVAITSSIPSTARYHALLILRRRLKELLKQKCSMFLILPFIMALLADKKQSIRAAAVELLRTIEQNESSEFESYFLGDEIYDQNSSKLATLNAKDVKSFYAELLKNNELYKMDQQAIFAKLNHLLEADKKNNKLLYAVFVSHALVNNLPVMKLILFKIVIDEKHVVKGVSLPSQLFEEFLKNYFDDRQTWENNCQEANVNFESFEQTVVGLVSEKEKNHVGVEFLIRCVLSDYPELSSVAIAKLETVFPHLKHDFQLEVVSKLIDSSNNTIDAVEVLQSLPLSSDLFVQLLKKSVLTQATEVTGTAKRRRRSSQTTRAAMKDSSVSKMASDHLKKITVILEILLGSEIGNVSFELLQRLLNALNDLESLDKDGNLPVVFTQEALASCMLKVVEILKQNPDSKKLVDQSTIRADSIIATIRSSSSPQVQNKLLLVVAALAPLIPETVLHSVMPIFTFMGAHTIRQDDEFSNHVVEQTILCVVPTFSNAAAEGKVEEVEFLTASFTSAFQHIPRHRRVKLFTTLAKTLGVSHSASLILFLCGQKYSEAYQKHKMADCRALLEFTSSFMKNFESSEQLQAILDYLKLWNLLPQQELDPESKEYKSLASRSIFGVHILSLTKAELTNLRNNMITFIDKSVVGKSDLSSLPHLRLKIASSLLEANEDDIVQINTVFGDLVQYILNDMISVAPGITSDAYKLLGDIMNLLPIQEFVESVLTIISPNSDSTTSDLSVKKHLIALTGTKFESESSTDPYAQEAADALVNVLIETVSSNEDTEITQSSLDTLSSILQRFGDKLDASVLTSCLNVVVGESGLQQQSSPDVLVASMNTITCIVSILGVKMIGFFPKIVPRVLEIFNESQEFQDKEIIQVSILILFSSMIKKLPAFMLSNLKDILRLIFNAKSVSESTRLSVLDVIVQRLTLKDVLKSLTAVWDDVSKMDAVAVGLYLHAMEFTIEKIDKKSATTESVVFFGFLLQGLEYRSQSNFDNNTIHRIEASLFQCAINYVMKLNDRTFRPLFASMVRWAFDGEGMIHEVSEVDRLAVFFRFFNKLQDSLRSIVTSYYAYLLENIEKLLTRFAQNDVSDINLRRIILISLTSSFKYDQDEFWASESRFEVISKVLTDQLSNIEDSIGKYLVKSIASLSQTCSSADHNKAMNELMMTHLHLSCAPREKFWTARTMKAIYQKVGDQWLSLLPQLVPLIAELLEDDDEEVEREVRSGLVKVIESVLGEPLDRYLD